MWPGCWTLWDWAGWTSPGIPWAGRWPLLLAEQYPQRIGRLVLEDVMAPRPRQAAVPGKPPGDLPYDWDMVLAVRRQIDAPDPAWLHRLGSITAPTLVIGGGPDSHIP